MKSDGAIYFTDSVNGLRAGGNGPARELSFNGFYLVKDGKVTLLDSEQGPLGDFPNGIAVSPVEVSFHRGAASALLRVHQGLIEL